MKNVLKKLALLTALLAFTAAPLEEVIAQEAKQIFGRMTLPANLKSQSYGFYTKGCLAGAVAMPVDGPTWQTMRLSRNRRWGHPNLIATIEELSIKANKSGWNGLLVGDISQPRGGPMLTGHASHQIGLDADLWLTPMPNKRMSYQERENTSAVSILKKGTNFVNDRRWNKSYEKLLYHAASFREVERVLVHPGIKKKLCETVKGDRSWLSKIRPVYGHHYHFHIRLRCQSDSAACKKQTPPPNDTGCGEPLKWWFDVALAPKKKSTKPAKPSKPTKKRIVTVNDLPNQCREVVSAGAKSKEAAEYRAASLSGFAAPQLDLPAKFDPMAVLNSKPIEASQGAKFAKAAPSVNSSSNNEIRNIIDGFAPITGDIPIPTPRPY
ncbi:MAG: penicillin-insensitive murein endopeptidase [Salaquimonas sp.]